MSGLRAAALALAVLAALPAAAQETPLPAEFHGRWALRAEWCKPAPTPDPDRIDPFTLTGRSIGFSDATCDFTSVLPGGVSWRVEATCKSGEETGAEFFTFTMLADRLHWGFAGNVEAFEKCPE